MPADKIAAVRGVVNDADTHAFHAAWLDDLAAA